MVNTLKFHIIKNLQNHHKKQNARPTHEKDPTNTDIEIKDRKGSKEQDLIDKNVQTGRKNILVPLYH